MSADYNMCSEIDLIRRVGSEGPQACAGSTGRLAAINSRSKYLRSISI
jgi:hypothetical protein